MFAYITGIGTHADISDKAETMELLSFFPFFS